MIRKTSYRGLLTAILLFLFRALALAQTITAPWPGSGTAADPYVMPAATYGSSYDNSMVMAITGSGNYASLNFFPAPPGLTLISTLAYELQGVPTATGTFTITGTFDPQGGGPYTYYQLTINPVPLTVTVYDTTKAYGAPMPTPRISYSGFVNGDDPGSVFNGSPTATFNANASSPVGQYSIKVNNDQLNAAGYTITYVDGTLTVTPDTLTITPNSVHTKYGVAAALTASYSGFVNGDNASGLTKAPMLTTDAPSSTPPVGSYDVSAGGAVDPNYIIVYGPTGTLTVDPTLLTITANDTMTYGGALPPLTFLYAGFVNGENSSDLTAQPGATITATSSSPAGNYPITINGAADPNYSIIYLPGTMVVEKAVLTVTARDQTMSYGGTVPLPAVSYSGFINGDDVSKLGSPPTASINATGGSPAGSYRITPNGGNSANYTFNYVDGTLTVVPVGLTITANPAGSTYGAPLVTDGSLTVSYSGFVNGDGANNLTSAPSVTNTAYAGAPVGTYTLTPAGAADPNYNITYNTGTYTIGPANLSVRAGNDTMTYGGQMPAASLSYSGFVNGDGPGNLSIPVKVSTVVTPASSVGKYPITVGGASSSNYNISYVDGELLIQPAVLTVTAGNATMTYGGMVPALPVSYSGFVNGDNASSLTTPATATTIANLASAAGTYPITAGGGQGLNYTFTYVPGVLTIDPAMLSVSADPESKVYGTPDPTLNYSVTGWVNGDNNSIFSGSLSRDPGENVGSYPITLGTLGAGGNYVLQFTGNDLSITKASQQISWTQKLLFGCDTTTQYQLTARASSGLPVTYMSSNAAVGTVAGDALTLVQPGTVTITASQLGDSNYLAAANVIDTGIDRSAFLVRQHWDDALFFDNSSDSFVQWQWYKNGNAIPGAIGPYYSESPSLNGQYYVIATETTGTTIQTCPLAVSGGGAVAGGIRVFPNPAAGGAAVSVVCNYPAAALQGARMEVINMQGKVWQQITNVQPSMQVTLPAAGGIYILSLQLGTGQRATVNVVVND